MFSPEKAWPDRHESREPERDLVADLELVRLEADDGATNTVELTAGGTTRAVTDCRLCPRDLLRGWDDRRNWVLK